MLFNAYERLFNAYERLFNAYERLFNAVYEKLLVCYEKLHKICGNKVDFGLWVVLKHVCEHVLSLRAILDNLPISINETINPVTTNLLKIYRNVCTQTSKYHILPNHENKACRVAAIENEILHIEHIVNCNKQSTSTTSDNFGRRSRSRNSDSAHIRKRDREPSRIPMKKLVNGSIAFIFSVKICLAVKRNANNKFKCGRMGHGDEVLRFYKNCAI